MCLGIPPTDLSFLCLLSCTRGLLKSFTAAFFTGSKFGDAQVHEKVPAAKVRSTLVLPVRLAEKERITT